VAVQATLLTWGIKPQHRSLVKRLEELQKQAYWRERLGGFYRVPLVESMDADVIVYLQRHLRIPPQQAQAIAQRMKDTDGIFTVEHLLDVEVGLPPRLYFVRPGSSAGTNHVVGGWVLYRMCAASGASSRWRARTGPCSRRPSGTTPGGGARLRPPCPRRPPAPMTPLSRPALLVSAGHKARVGGASCGILSRRVGRLPYAPSSTWDSARLVVFIGRCGGQVGAAPRRPRSPSLHVRGRAWPSRRRL
jgi:hypothetical protein